MGVWSHAQASERLGLLWLPCMDEIVYRPSNAIWWLIARHGRDGLRVWFWFVVVFAGIVTGAMPDQIVQH